MGGMGMHKSAIWTLLALLAAVFPALAGVDSDRLNQAGMLGSWAVDCSAPPSPNNPYQLFAPSTSGSPTRTLQMDTPSLDGTLKVKDVHIISNERVGLSWVDRSGDTMRMVVLKTGNRLKGFESVSERSGKTLVKDGRFTNSGKETPWFTKCGTR
jgi:hypothetical protein